MVFGVKEMNDKNNQRITFLLIIYYYLLFALQMFFRMGHTSNRAQILQVISRDHIKVNCEGRNRGFSII